MRASTRAQGDGIGSSRGRAASAKAAAVLVGLVGLAGCTTPQAAAGGGAGTTPAARRAYVPCADAREVRLSPSVCWDPTGSRWSVTAQAPSGELTFSLELMAGGRVRATDHATAGPASDEWFVDEGTLRVFLGDRFVEYRAELTNATLLSGEAMNVRGDGWSWRATRAHGGACAAGELVTRAGDDPACFTAAGARYRVEGAGAAFVAELGAGGALRSDDPRDTTAGDDTWTQVGASLALSFDGGARVYAATLPASGVGALDLTGSGAASGRAHAEPIASYAPPMH